MPATKQTAEILRERIRGLMVTPKIISIVALSSLAILCGCGHKARAEPKTISAGSDAAGSHPANADVDGPVMVTCVSATEDTGAVAPPACVVTAPGTKGVVKIGDKVAVIGAGKVVLTCQGQGTLACVARIEE